MKKVLGDKHPDYTTSLDNLGELYQSMGNYAAAEAFLKQALAIRKEVLGEEDPDYAVSLSNLASLYHIVGNYTAAELLFKQALIIIKGVFGEEDPQYATILNNLASLYLSMGNYASAESWFEQALNVIKKASGENHPDYASILNNLAALNERVGNYEAAESLQTQALTIQKKVLGEEHPLCVQSLNNLAYEYYLMGNYAAAEPMFKQVLAVQKRLIGEEHPNYAATLNNLALVYEGIENYTAAETLDKQASVIYKKVLGEKHPDYANNVRNLATLYECMGNYVEAANYFTLGTNLTFDHIEKNFNNLSETEKLIWWEKERRYFEGAPSLLFTNPNASRSFLQQTCTQQLQLKGFILNDGAKILREVRKKGSPYVRQLLNQWQGNKATLAKQYSLPIDKRIPQLESLEKQTNEQEKQINLQSGAFRNSGKNLQIGFAEVQKKLKRDEAALEFIRFKYYHKQWTDSVLYAAFIILPNDIAPHFVTLCEEKQLSALLESKSNSSEQLVKQLYRGVIVPNNQTESKKGDSLYNLVWKPLLPWLKGIKKISIAPAGLLNRVAFNALPIGTSHYLIDDYVIRQYSSVRQIAEQKILAPKTSLSTDAVLYGGIDFSIADSTSHNDTANNTLPDNVKQSIGGSIWNHYRVLCRK